MKLKEQNPKQSLNKAYLKEKVSRTHIELFKKNLSTLLGRINTEESEEHLKNVISDFLKDTWYKELHEINTKDRKDLVIHTGKTTKDPVGVILEVKKPSNKTEMMSASKPNAKAMHELMLYYLRERTEQNNIDIKYLVITNIYEWYIIDEVWFEKNIYRNSKLKKDYENWKHSGNFYVSESFDLLTLMEEGKAFSNNDFYLDALTDENNKISATELAARNVIPHQSKLKMQSYGFINHTEVKHDFGNEKPETEEEKRQVIYYLELEGLKMSYSDLTEIFRARRGVKIKDVNNWERDHTGVMLIYDGSSNSPCNNFNLTFFKKENSNNIIVAFPNSRDNGSNILYYDVFNEFKRDFISFLSFLNGAEIKVRTEYVGGYYNIGKVNTQTIITYSYKEINNERPSKYIPLNNDFHRGENILNYSLIHCFNRFIQINKSLDLSSIIFYLNGAERTKNLEEKFFILIIAFERISQKYIDSIDDKELFILTDDVFKPIKEELLNVLNRNKKNIGDKINSIAGIIGDINKIRNKTEIKFRKLLEYAKIDVNNDIDLIINEVRHKSIHRGEIGTGKQGVRHYFVLDELLRDIILNLVGYEKARESRYRDLVDKKIRELKKETIPLPINIKDSIIIPPMQKKNENGQ